MRYSVFATAILAPLALTTPFNGRIELQEVIKAVLEDAPTSGVVHHSAHAADDKVHPDPSSPVVTKLDPLGRTQEICFWSGTAPFCEGECPAGWTDKGASDCGDGKCCATGSKRRCCRTFDLDNCAWSGTAPFCEGACIRYAELEVGRDYCGDGKCCATGTKAKCCKPVQ